MKTNQICKVIPLLVLLMAFFSCKNEATVDNTAAQITQNEKPESQKGQAFIDDESSTLNVLQIAIKSPDHTTLVAAVQAAGLENVLVNAGPLMVFAPTNEAFAALPEGTVDDLLKPENKEKLAAILKHHVTAGNYDKDFLKNFKKLGQADDTNATVEVKGDDVYVGGAKILASVKAGNGIVHVVDKVILPVSN
tara:strand:+ start:2405 stop:2983 length:579 start_codon:yes stop_codon:yes gene_type:complete